MLDCMEMGPNSPLLGRDTQGLVLFLRLMANTSAHSSLNNVSDPSSLWSLNVKESVLMGGILDAHPSLIEDLNKQNLKSLSKHLTSSRVWTEALSNHTRWITSISIVPGRGIAIFFDIPKKSLQKCRRKFCSKIFVYLGGLQQFLCFTILPKF